MNVKIVRCDCKNQYQDQKYGLGLRVMNLAHKPPSWRCTVCGKTHPR